MSEALPSQQIVSIEQVREGVLIVKGGGLRSVLLSSGVNFALKSEAEQQAIIAAFQEFLASLDFSIQFVTHSRRINIDKYLAEVEEVTRTETNDLLSLQSQEYLKFIRSFVELYSVMEKRFFVVVPYDPTVRVEAVKGGMLRFLKRGKAPIVETHYSDEEFRRHVGQLGTRRDQVISGLQRIGIQTVPLATEELIELYYNFYNPMAREKRARTEPSPFNREATL